MPKGDDLVVQNTTSKYKLHLSLVRMMRLVVQDPEPTLQRTKPSLNSDPKGRMPKVEELSRILWPSNTILPKVIPDSSI